MARGQAAIEFTWDMFYTCNYRCAYCWWDSSWTALAESTGALPPAARWIEAWGRFQRNHGPARIYVLGGEPFLYPSFAALVKALAMDQGHFVGITSNFSMPKKVLEKFIEPLSYEKVRLSCSFHPQFATIESVLEKMAFLSERGFPPDVTVVSWPPALPDLIGYRERFREKGILMHARIFRGNYNGKSYPESFTPQERRQLRGLLGNGVRADYEVDMRSPLGEPCYAGAVYANIKPNGNIYRCGRSERTDQPMGNLFADDFRLFDGAVACPFELCSCNEYKYLARIRDARRHLVRSGL